MGQLSLLINTLIHTTNDSKTGRRVGRPHYHAREVEEICPVPDDTCGGASNWVDADECKLCMVWPLDPPQLERSTADNMANLLEVQALVAHGKNDKNVGAEFPEKPAQTTRGGIQHAGSLDASDGSQFHWALDVGFAGYEQSSKILLPPTLEFLEKEDQTNAQKGSASLVLRREYGVILVGDLWNPERSYSFLMTMRSIPQSTPDEVNPVSTNIAISVKIVDEELAGGFNIRSRGEWEISSSCFQFARPRLVRLDEERGHYFSQKLHHTLVNLITNSGKDSVKALKILRERFGVEVSTDPNQTQRMMSKITLATKDDVDSFDSFHPPELVDIINMMEEMPPGLHKVSGLRWLLRRRDGVPHPVYPNAAAVTWPENEYIEFMESSFSGMDHWDTHRLILHEKCHMLYAHVLSNEIKDAWIKIGGWVEEFPDQWYTTKTAEFVSAYAHDHNPNEDLAESVAFFILNPAKLESRSPEKYNFIRHFLMDGDRYLTMVRKDLEFEVLNLWPRYTYPGKICRVDVTVTGKPKEDKQVTVEIELSCGYNGNDYSAERAYMRLHSRANSFMDVHLLPKNKSGSVLAQTFSISKYAAAGNWAPRNIMISDSTGLERMEGHHDFGWRLFLINPLEILQPPMYIPGSAEMKVTKKDVVDGHEVQILSVSFKIENPNWCAEGPNSAYASIVNSSSGQYRLERYSTVPRSSLNVATVDFQITEFMAPGMYDLRLIKMTDIADNITSVEFGKDERMEPEVQVQVMTTKPDLQGPEIDIEPGKITVEAAPTNRDEPNGETKVTITYFARDPPDRNSGAASGVGKVSGVLVDPQGGRHFDYHYHSDFYTPFFSGPGDPSDWHQYVWERILPAGSTPGKWGLASMTIQDKASNQTNIDFTEILHFHLEHTPNSLATCDAM